MPNPPGEAEDQNRKCLAPESIGSPIRYVVIVIDSRTPNTSALLYGAPPSCDLVTTLRAGCASCDGHLILDA